MAAVTLMLANYPADGAQATEVARAQAWAMALEDLPAWAVERAVRMWLQGKFEGVNTEFAPKPPTFRLLVEKLLEPVHEQRAQLSMLLKAKVEEEPYVPASQEERLRVLAAAEEAKREVAKIIADAGKPHFPGRTEPQPLDAAIAKLKAESNMTDEEWAAIPDRAA